MSSPIYPATAVGATLPPAIVEASTDLRSVRLTLGSGDHPYLGSFSRYIAVVLLPFWALLPPSLESPTNPSVFGRTRAGVLVQYGLIASFASGYGRPDSNSDEIGLRS